VDSKQEIREFLTSRRARITPDQVELASYGPRRVPGLRREEVAVLASVSVPYYSRLERGDINCWAPVNLGMKRASRAVHGGDEPVAAQDGVGVVLVGVQHE